MSPSPEKFFRMVLESICKHSDKIDMQIEEDDKVLRFNVTVAPEDMKYVIWRKGKTINTLRQCTRIMWSKSDKRIYFNLIES